MNSEEKLYKGEAGISWNETLTKYVQHYQRNKGALISKIESIKR